MSRQGVYFILFLISFSANSLLAQSDSVLFSGKIFESQHKDPVEFARIYISELAIGTISNQYGGFQLKIPPGHYEIRVQSAEYDPQTFRLDLTQNKTIDLFLTAPATTQIENVVISAKAEENIKSAQMGRVDLTIEEIKKMPAFLGEVDVLKTIQMLPGVSSATEGGQGFYVRGGGPDQNLVLLDDATVYNASHLFGFFSVFNADAIKSVSLSRGTLSANFGGRLSSVLEVNMAEGNKEKFGVSGGLGLISSRLSVNGPLKKNKGSFLIAARRTYVDVIMGIFLPKDSDFKNTKYFFQDFNAKFSYQLTNKDFISLSGYFGKDAFVYRNSKEDFNVEMPWQNGTASFKWTHIFNPKWIFQLIPTYSHYKFTFGSNSQTLNMSLSSIIHDYGLKAETTYLPNARHKVKFGAQYTYHRLTPTSVSANQDSVNFNTGLSQTLNGHELGIYVMDDWDITEKFRVNIGLRYTNYTFVGPFTRYIKGSIIQEDQQIHYKGGEPISFNQALEPRIGLRYEFSKKNAIKGAFSYNNQYIHLASFSSVSMPTDIWYPVTDLAKPQTGWQAAMGYFQNFRNNMFETSVEVYYKKMNHLVEFREGAIPTEAVNDNTDNLMAFGKGWSYGIEFFIKKNIGKWTGWIGYTLSKTNRQFDLINEGKIFRAKYDRRHDLSAVVSYTINDRWRLGANFIYASGNAMTMPSAWYIYDQQMLLEYTERNSTKMPAYHRLDFSVTWFDKAFKLRFDPATQTEIQVPKRFRSNIVFSVYNTYNRANPYFLYLSDSGSLEKGDFKITTKQVSLFPILPSVTWNFEF